MKKVNPCPVKESKDRLVICGTFRLISRHFPLSLSRNLKTKVQTLTPEEIDRLVRMGWEDRTPFEAIKLQFGFSPNEFVKFMRHVLEAKAFQRWRRRVFEQGRLKNQSLRGFKTTRFKCARQFVDGETKGWK